MDKKEYVNSLKNVKIVLGNGFDLHCGLHTKYSDYYCKNFRKYLFIKQRFNSYEGTGVFNFNDGLKLIKNINTWDVFFVLNGPDDPRQQGTNWCDIEKLIYSSLIPYSNNITTFKNQPLFLMPKIHWDVIESLLSLNHLGKNYEDRFVVEFIKTRSKFVGFGFNDFYQFLLKELKEFEKNFGDFIYHQIHDPYLEKINFGSKVFLNSDYLNDAVFTINELCDENNITSIDSFNYSIIEKPSIKEKFQNINGTYLRPIFGIDTKFLPDDKQYIFTKTARRIDADMIDDTFAIKPYFENVIIYGHSLNEADFSYFFPLFDKLNLIDSTAVGVLVFAYSVYDKSIEDQIESRLRMSIAKIIFEYAKSKRLSDPERLLDSLSTQKRVITLAINEINKWSKPQTELDKEWNTIYLDMDLAINTKQNL